MTPNELTARLFIAFIAFLALLSFFTKENK